MIPSIYFAYKNLVYKDPEIPVTVIWPPNGPQFLHCPFYEQRCQWLPNCPSSTFADFDAPHHPHCEIVHAILHIAAKGSSTSMIVALLISVRDGSFVMIMNILWCFGDWLLTTEKLSTGKNWQPNWTFQQLRPFVTSFLYERPTTILLLVNSTRNILIKLRSLRSVWGQLWKEANVALI